MENEDAEMTAPVEACIKHASGMCAGVVLGLLGRVLAMTMALLGEIGGAIISRTHENRGGHLTRVGWFGAEIGLWFMGEASVTIGTSLRITDDTIVSRTLENGGEETTAPIGEVVKRESVMVALQRETVSIIISGTFKNRGEEMMALVRVLSSEGCGEEGGYQQASSDGEEVTLPSRTRLFGRASPMAVALRREEEYAIISVTLENGDERRWHASSQEKTMGRRERARIIVCLVA
ncbi:hypothetical protein ARMGADRAFT_1034657 [Armillaria gallica]|uniref:Uncharacterized protein n=1 Tax=Armillaria gallica TaxID=47427 RepID=A0A2H3DHN1_ARMGA|nr:hypothetical protein ARMGADRAFT_1034657 [Armillaria gallica]